MINKVESEQIKGKFLNKLYDYIKKNKRGKLK